MKKNGARWPSIYQESRAPARSTRAEEPAESHPSPMRSLISVPRCLSRPSPPNDLFENDGEISNNGHYYDKALPSNAGRGLKKAKRRRYFAGASFGRHGLMIHWSIYVRCRKSPMPALFAFRSSPTTLHWNSLEANMTVSLIFYWNNSVWHWHYWRRIENRSSACDENFVENDADQPPDWSIQIAWAISRRAANGNA